MNIPQHKLDEFQHIYEEVYGAKLTEDEVLSRALLVLRIIRATYK